MTDETLTPLESKRAELTALSEQHAAAVEEMNAAKIVLDNKLAAVHLLNEKLAKANEEYMRLELAAA